MSINASTEQAVIDAEFEVIASQPNGLSQEQLSEARAQAITAAVDNSATLDVHKSSSGAAISGYEASFKALLGNIRDAMAAGAKTADLATAFKEDNAAAVKRGESRPHTWTSTGAINGLEMVGQLLRFDAALPEGWVWRAGKDGTITLLEGERSLTDLVSAVIRPSDAVRDALREYAKANSLKQDTLYGKKLVEQVVGEAATIEDAVAALVRTAKQQGKTAKTYLDGLEAAAKNAEAEAESESNGDDEEVAVRTAEDVVRDALAVLRQAKGLEVADRAALLMLVDEVVAAATAL